MKERPILFSGEMVRAILDGRKTMTRRVIDRRMVANWDAPRGASDVSAGYPLVETRDGELVSALKLCPYGQPGDRLWVRETFQIIHVSIDHETGYGDDFFHSKKIPKAGSTGPMGIERYWNPVYKASDDHANESTEDRGFPWRPSIHMPRWASRITLEVAGVRVERLRDITEEGAKAEGVSPTCPIYGDCGGYKHEGHKEAFTKLWGSIYAKRGFGWDVNPWVWVIEFKRIPQP